MRSPGSPPRQRPAPFRALRVRNYRLFFIGQILSVIGTWTQNTAIAWIVLQGRSSSVDLGAIVALQFLPLLLLGVWAGAIADRIGFQPGDAILQIGARAVKNSRDFSSALGEVRPGSDTVMLVVRGQYSYYVTIPL